MYSMAQRMLIASVLCCAARAQTFTTVASFNLANNTPENLIQAADGNFYGVAMGSGAGCAGNGATCAAIFKLTSSGVLTTLNSFSSATTVNPLMQASDGNFYGTGYIQQANSCVSGSASVTCGMVFQVTPAGVMTTLYKFSLTDGAYPTGSLVQGEDGSLYGVTIFGGTGSCPGGSPSGCGTFFKITPAGVLTTLHSFTPTEAITPLGVLLATDGNFYGYSVQGGCCGTILKITPSGSVAIIHGFTGGKDGEFPTSLLQGADGNLYGATSRGIFFEETLAGTFTSANIGTLPHNLVSTADGNIYFITASGFGTVGTSGAILRYSPATQTPTLVYTFCSQTNCTDGQAPVWLTRASDGNLYGLTGTGGSTGYGTLFELALPAAVTPPSNLPQILTSGGVLNGASFQAGIASNSWVTIKGTNLAPKIDDWANAINGGVLPMSLDGVSVSVGGQPAYIEYISPTQINAVAPTVSAGNLNVTVTTPVGTSQAVTSPAASVQPAFFQWGNYAVATTLQYADAVKNGVIAGLTSTASAPGQVIVLWGTGFGPTSPSFPPGYETPSTTTYNTASQVTVTVGGVQATVYGAALAPGYAGLYQIALQVPATLTNGDYSVVATIGGVQSPSSTLLTVQQ